MGLDSVELVMEFEEAFGIKLEDEEVTKTVTPRMVIDLIFSKLKTADERICRSQRAFYTIRRVLVQTFGLDRKSITPDMRLRDSISKPREKEVWEQMKAALSPRSWPALVLPRWMSRSILVLCFAVFVAGVIATIPLSRHVGAAFACGIALAGLFGIIGVIITRPSRTLIPPRFQSIRDMIPYAITSDRMTGWTREEVAVVVKRITTEQLGLDESEYTEDSRFVEDFHVG
jgi:acyl carrier protein